MTATDGAPGDEKAKKRAERVKRLAKQLERQRTEERVLAQGTYAEAVSMRAREFPERVANDAAGADAWPGAGCGHAKCARSNG